MIGLESRPVHPQICLPIYLPTNDPPIFHLIPSNTYLLYLPLPRPTHSSISSINIDSRWFAPMSVQASGLLQVRGFQLFDLQRALPCKSSKKKGWHSATSGKSGCHPCGIGWCTIASDFFAVHSTLSPRRSFAARNPEDLSRKPSGRGRNPHWHPVRMSVGCFMFQRDYHWATSPTLLELCRFM